MPRYLIPKRSGVHRVACFALYRALLRQGSRLQFEEGQRSKLLELVRATFRRNARIQSPRDITSALKLGYKTLKTLSNRASRQSEGLPCLQHALENILSVTPSKTIAELSTPGLHAKLEPLKKSIPARPVVHALRHAPKVLSRPFPVISGRRHVPTLVNATGIPFLRFKKPQSPFLSRIIRNKIRKRERLFNILYELQHSLKMAQEEDRWDKILREKCGVGDTKGKRMTVVERSWAAVTRDALYETSRKLRAEHSRNALIASKMHEIIVKETALAMEERLATKGRKQ